MLVRALIRGESPVGFWHDPGDVFEHDGRLGMWMEPAGSSLPGLSGKSKAELLEVAADEGVDVAENATKAQIMQTIEAARGE